MIDPFVVLEVMAAIIVAVFLGQILRITLKVLFYTLLFVLVMIFVFGISYDEMVRWVINVLTLAF